MHGGGVPRMPWGVHGSAGRAPADRNTCAHLRQAAGRLLGRLDGGEVLLGGSGLHGLGACGRWSEDVAMQDEPVNAPPRLQLQLIDRPA